MNRKVPVVLFLASLIVVAACAGFGQEETSFVPPPGISTVEPCVAAVGETVHIKGFFPGSLSPIIRFGATAATIVSSDSSHITVTVPVGAGAGVTAVSPTGSSGVVAFSVGTRVTVPEVEPNDSVAGADATSATTNRSGSGVLSDVSDKDHFVFDCLRSKSFRVVVSPAGTVGTVFVDGVGHPLDAGGKTASIAFATDTALVGLTGGTGAYTVSLEYVP